MSKRTLWLFVACLCCVTILSPLQAQAVDFSQKYGRGKLFLRKGLYIDAIRELYQAVAKTSRGQNHFGAHYYLAIAYYRIGDITRAMRALTKGKKLTKKKSHVQRADQLIAQIKVLFGKLRIIPEVDPEEVGPLKIKIRTKTPFSHAQKRRTYRILSSRWQKKGILADGKPFYLPKGEYYVEIALPQCLVYGLTLGPAIMRSVSISGTDYSVALKKKASCECPGGQKPKKLNNGKLTCECPSGTVWSQKRQRCEIPKTAGGGGVSPVLIGAIVGGVVVVGGGVAAGLLLYTSATAPVTVNVNGNVSFGAK